MTRLSTKALGKLSKGNLLNSEYSCMISEERSVLILFSEIEFFGEMIAALRKMKVRKFLTLI